MSMEFENETQDFSAAVSCGGEDARSAPADSAQDEKCAGVSGCLDGVDGEFGEILRVLAEC